MKMAALVTSSEALDLKLRKALGLMAGALPFDEVSLYLLDDEAGALVLRAGARSSSGAGAGMASQEEGGALRETPPSYGPGEGLGVIALKTGAPVTVRGERNGGDAYKGVEDIALKGFGTVLIHPLLDGIRPYGVIYLKGRGRVSLAGDEEAFLRLALLQVVSMLKFSEVVDDCREAVDEAEALRQRLSCAGELLLLGDIAASLAHEIKNPLLCLGGFAARLRRKLGPDSPLLEDVRELTRAVARIEGVINTMVAPLRNEAAAGEINDLNEALEEAASRFGGEMTRLCVKLERDYCARPLRVCAGRQELKIIFDNLIANALQCMNKGGGTLRLGTALDGGWAVAEVSDSGGGIDPCHLASIFRPFFTTKKEGTGLGLPITSSIVSRLRGVIDVINRLGEGVTFRVKLPPSQNNDVPEPAAQR